MRGLGKKSMSAKLGEFQAAFIQAQQGNILIRKTESGKIVHVHDHSDLKDVTNNDKSSNNIELMRGNSLRTSDSLLNDGLSTITHISDYEYYIDSDV